MSAREAERILARHWDGKNLPIQPVAIAKAMGVNVAARSSGHESGRFQYQDDGRPEIWFEPSEPRVRQRFTIAHELGHFVLNHGPQFRDGVQNFNLAARDWREREANAFAANLLMPRQAVDVAIADLGFTDIERLAQAFDVSQVAMKYRLQDLGWL